MASFIITSSAILPFRANTIPAKCSLKKNIFTRASFKSGPVMQTTNFSPNDEMDDEDDSTIMGSGDGPGPGHGIRAPLLSPSDRIYLDGAKNNKEYMARMTEIARKIKRNKQIQDATNPKQSADQYIETLSRRHEPPSEGDYGSPRVDPAEQYMENLSRMYREGNRTQERETPSQQNRRTAAASAGSVVDPTFAAKPTDSVSELEDKMRAIEAEINQVSQGISQSEEESIAQEVMEKLNEMARIRETEDAAEDAKYTTDATADMTLEEGARKVAELQRQIREAAGLEEGSESDSLQISNEIESEPGAQPSVPEAEPEHESGPEPNSEASVPGGSLRQSHIGKDTGTVDRQIQFLENHLSKLQEEAEADQKPDAKQSVPEEPKHNFAEEAQIAMSEVAEEISKFPSKRTTFEGLEDTPGGMNAEEKMAVFEELRRRAASAQPSSEFADPLNVSLPERKAGGDDDYGDEPSPESEAEYDSFESSYENKSLLIEEIETEIKAYSRDLKVMLQKHETRLQVLLTRLRAL